MPEWDKPTVKPIRRLFIPEWDKPTVKPIRRLFMPEWDKPTVKPSKGYLYLKETNLQSNPATATI
jgi:hypothetical protein